MFSEFVNFKEVGLIINNSLASEDFELKAIDISHDNEIYQVAIEIKGNDNDAQEITKFIKKQLRRHKQLSIKLNYELKKTNIPIEDLYTLLPERNLKLEIKKIKNRNFFLLNCQLIARNNVYFDYQINKVVNF